MTAMVKFLMKSFALKWYYFSCPASISLYCEYFNLFMKQLGFNPAQIGFTTLLGVLHLLIPLCLLFGEKFRARKIVAVFGTIGVLVCSTLPLLALIVPALQPACFSTTFNDSVEATSQGILTDASVRLKSDASVRLKYANDTSSLFASETLPYLSSTYTISSTPILRNCSVVYSENIIRRSRIILSDQSQSTPGPNHSSHSSNTKQLPGLSNNTSFSTRKFSTSKIKKGYSNDTEKPSASSIHYLPSYISRKLFILKNSSLPSDNSDNSTRSFKIPHLQPWLSQLFLILVLSRSLTVALDRTDLAIANLATITHLKEESSNYGVYFMWSNAGSALSICSVAVLAWFIRIYICEVKMYGYFTAFVWGGVMSLLSLFSLPYFKFEYNEKNSFNWSGVKSDVLNAHYIFMFTVLFYTGLCLSFQAYWEFWYLDGLSASPLLLGGAVLIRRPLIALSTLGSSYLMKKVGELKTVCVALFLYALSFFALSFTRTAFGCSHHRHASSGCQWYQLLRLYCAFLQGLVARELEHYSRIRGDSLLGWI